MTETTPAPFSFARLFKDVPPPEPAATAAAEEPEPAATAAAEEEPLVVSKTAPYLDPDLLSEASDAQLAATREEIISERVAGEKARAELKAEIRVLEEALHAISEMQAPWAVALDKIDEEQSLRAGRAVKTTQRGPRP